MNKEKLLAIRESLLELTPDYENLDFGPAISNISQRRQKSIQYVNEALKNLGRIEYRKGNLLNVDAGVIIHGCNLHGVMGAGVAKSVKEKYPQCYMKYVSEVKDCYLGESIGYIVNDFLVIENLLTQRNFGRYNSTRYVSYDAIADGFKMLNMKHASTTPFHFPQIGSGLGGGDWTVIEKIIESECPSRQLICWVL